MVLRKPFMDTATPIILASASPSRRALLEAAGLTLSVQPTQVDESSIKRQMETQCAQSHDIALALAKAKGCAGSSKNPHALIIAADQILVCDGTLFDKPVNMKEARQHLMALRGKTHRLIGASVLYHDSALIWSHVDTADMTMRDFSASFLDDYLHQAGDSILASVGAYKLEDIGVHLFDAIDGGYFTILGLPILPLLTKLRALGVIQT